MWPNIGVNPLQLFATDDGWFDFAAGPTLEGLLQSVAAAGFSAILADLPAGMVPSEYADELDRHSLRPAPGYIAIPSLRDPSQRERFLARCAEASRTHVALGLSVIFVGPDVWPDHPRFRHPAVGYAFDQRQLEDVTLDLRTVSQAITREGVRPVLHPHVGSWIETESEVRFALDAIPSSELGFGPDTGHLAWAGIDTVDLVHDYADRVGAAHFKDVRLDVARRCRQVGHDYRGTVAAGLWAEPGSGDLDLDAILAALPDPNIWLEVEVDRPSDGDARSSLELSARWASSLAGSASS